MFSNLQGTFFGSQSISKVSQNCEHGETLIHALNNLIATVLTNKPSPVVFNRSISSGWAIESVLKTLWFMFHLGATLYTALAISWEASCTRWHICNSPTTAYWKLALSRSRKTVVISLVGETIYSLRLGKTLLLQACIISFKMVVSIKPTVTFDWGHCCRVPKVVCCWVCIQCLL